jgi:hypothetical protein
MAHSAAWGAAHGKEPKINQLLRPKGRSLWQLILSAVCTISAMKDAVLAARMYKHMKNKIMQSCIFLTISALLCAGCAADKSDNTVIATVNGQPIYLKEFKRELSIRVKQNPTLETNDATIEKLADTLIDRQIIIQEAMKKNMAQEEKFVDTIKAFWEQTLIRDFIERKNNEFGRYVFVTDKEVKDYYGTLKKQNPEVPPYEEAYEQLKETIEQKKKSQALENWLNDRRRDSKIITNKKLITQQITQ